MTKTFTAEQLRCLELSAIIREGLPEIDLEMSDYRNYCGTAACIAGLACAVYDRRTWEANEGGDIHDSAGDLLGLTRIQAGQLFAPWVFGGPGPDEITSDMAASVLANLAITRKVEWPET